MRKSFKKRLNSYIQKFEEQPQAALFVINPIKNH